jgi:DTW domain-containing protein YfiP
MMKRIPLLTRLPAIELSDQHLRMLRMRQNRQMGRMSTFEAVAKVLGLIEGPVIEQRLMEHYDRIVSRMLMMRGKLKARDLPT